MHMVQLMPLPPYFIKIKICLTFLVPAYPGCPGKKRVVLFRDKKRVLLTDLDLLYVYSIDVTTKIGEQTMIASSQCTLYL